jgi:hypothetical protein
MIRTKTCGCVGIICLPTTFRQFSSWKGNRYALGMGGSRWDFLATIPATSSGAESVKDGFDKVTHGARLPAIHMHISFVPAGEATKPVPT